MDEIWKGDSLQGYARETGFWDRYRREGGESGPGWEFLELETCFTKEGAWQINAMDFLHGSCDAFAQCLHGIFGYELEYVFAKDYEAADKDGEAPYGLVHAYCKTRRGGRYAYVDIRGVTYDYREFMEDFLDFYDPDDDECLVLSKAFPLPDFVHAGNEPHMEAAERFIREYYEYFSPEPLSLCIMERMRDIK